MAYTLTQSLEVQDKTDSCPTATCVRISPNGKYIAYGTKNGQVVVCERDTKRWDFKYLASVSAYQPQIDPLHNVPIEARVTDMTWLPQCNASNFVITTNEKAIKLWKIYERKGRIVSGQNCNSFLGVSYSALAMQRLEVPHLIHTDSVPEVKCKASFETRHEYHINSVSLSSDSEQFLSADDASIRLWNIGHTDESLLLVNLRVSSEDTAPETIACAQFSHSNCSLFGFGTTKGVCNLVDLRMNLTVGEDDKFACSFDGAKATTSNVFASMTVGVTDVLFSPSGRYVATRDLLTVKIWDQAMSSFPVKVLNVHECVRSRLPEIYDTEMMLDQFEAAFSADGKQIYTGTYRNEVVSFDVDRGTSQVLSRAKRVKPPGKSFKDQPQEGVVPFEDCDFGQKSLTISSNPKSNGFAVGNGNEVVIWSQSSTKESLFA